MLYAHMALRKEQGAIPRDWVNIARLVNLLIVVDLTPQCDKGQGKAPHMRTPKFRCH